jgi:hypothetical protein
MSVEPGTTVPITGIASDNASRKIAARAYCGCPPIKSTIAAKYDVIVFSYAKEETAQCDCGESRLEN